MPSWPVKSAHPMVARSSFTNQCMTISGCGSVSGESASSIPARKVWESLEWIPKVEDMQNYLLTSEAGVSAPISKALSVSLILQDTYKSVPAIGKLKNDLKLIAGLTYTF